MLDLKSAIDLRVNFRVCNIFNKNIETITFLLSLTIIPKYFNIFEVAYLAILRCSKATFYEEFIFKIKDTLKYQN